VSASGGAYPPIDPWQTAARKGADHKAVDEDEAAAEVLLARYVGPTFPATDRAPVLIEWDDATQPSHGWVAPGDIDPTPAICHSVGWIVHKDERAITLASTKCDGGEVMGAMRIPAGTVRKITSLTP